MTGLESGSTTIRFQEVRGSATPEQALESVVRWMADNAPGLLVGFLVGLFVMWLTQMLVERATGH